MVFPPKEYPVRLHMRVRLPAPEKGLGVSSLVSSEGLRS